MTDGTNVSILLSYWYFLGSDTARCRRSSRAGQTDTVMLEHDGALVPSTCLAVGHSGTYSVSVGPFNRVTDQSGRRSLRSASTSRLVVPPVTLSTVANRAFPVVGARTWKLEPPASRCDVC